MESGPLAGDFKCSPASSMWALETLMTKGCMGLGRRPSGEHGGGSDLIDGEIRQPPPPPASFIYARSGGHMNSLKMLGSEGEGSTARRASWRRRLLAARWRKKIVALQRRGTGAAAALVPKAYKCKALNMYYLIHQFSSLHLAILSYCNSHLIQKI
jgi:hypothetical protein